MDLDYRGVRGLSIEVQQKLNAHKPETIGQATRISGITPAAISLLLVHLKRGERAAVRSATRRAAKGMHGARRAAFAMTRQRRLRSTDRLRGLRARCRPARRRAGEARRVRRPAREVEPHVQPDRDSRARADDHASSARRARGDAASAAARAAAPARRRRWRRRSRHPARDRAARVDGCARRFEPKEGDVPRAGGRRAGALQCHRSCDAHRRLRACSAVRRRDLARVRRSAHVRRNVGARISRKTDCSSR